jgi:hypothetical protein
VSELCPSQPAKSPVALGNEEGGHRCSAPVTPFLDQPKYGSGQVQEGGLAGCEGHSGSVAGRAGQRRRGWAERETVGEVAGGRGRRWRG